MTIEEFGRSWVGREVKGEDGILAKVVSFRVGARKAGVWLRLTTGLSVYKKTPRKIVRQ